MLLPRIKGFPVHKCGVIVIANVISSFRLSGTDFGDEVSVHDYISKHGTGIRLHGRPRSKEEKGKAAGKHLDRTASNLFFLFSLSLQAINDGIGKIEAYSRMRAACRGAEAADVEQGSGVWML